jgi:hypothetical protein
MAYRPPVRTQRTASRPIYGRRRRQLNYRAFAVIVTVLLILIILVARACGSSSSSPDLKDYADASRLLIDRSNAIGALLQDLPVRLPNYTRETLVTDLDKWAEDARRVSDEAPKKLVNVPQLALPAHAYLLTTFKARAEGVAGIKAPLVQATVVPEEAAMNNLQVALNQLLLSDIAYGYFAQEIKAQLTKAKQESQVVTSAYVKDTALGRSDKQAELIRTIQKSDKLKTTTNLAIVEVKTDPDALGNPDNGVFRLPAKDSFEVNVAVLNRGNVKVEKINVVGRLYTPSGGQNPQVKNGMIDVVEPGDKKTVPLRGLVPDRGDGVNFIKVEGASADFDPTSNEKSFQFIMSKG